MNGSLWALNALNFFMADVRDGLGPFLGALVGMVATAPLGALVDRIESKRTLVAAAAVVTVLVSLMLLYWPSFVPTAISQGLSGIAGAAIAPAIAGMTLGIVKQKGYAHQTGRNEAFNHAGNVAAALLAGALGYAFGFVAVFGVMAGMALASIVAVYAINEKDIDHRAARGLPPDASVEHSSSWSMLLTCTPLLVLAATLTLFHLGNAAMLPLLGQALVARGAGDASAYTGATIVVAQLTMVPMALLAAKLAQTRGYWIVFLLALIALPVRGVVAAVVTGPVGLVPVQILDGVGAGLLGVAVPGLVARILDGTGHVNVGLGVVMTMQGVGAALSPAFGGFVAENLGYDASFLVLGLVAAAALALWVLARSVTAESCGGRPSAATL